MVLVSLWSTGSRRLHFPAVWPQSFCQPVPTWSPSISGGSVPISLQMVGSPASGASFQLPQRYKWMTLMCVSLATWLTGLSFILDIQPRYPSDFLITPCNSLRNQLSPTHQNTCIYGRWMEKNTDLIPFSGKMGSNKEPVRPVENSCWLAMWVIFTWPWIVLFGVHCTVWPAASTIGSIWLWRPLK